MGKSTAIAIIACNRPGHFQRVLDSLVNNPEVGARHKTIPIRVFLDHSGDPAIAEAHMESVRRLKSPLVDITVIERSRNMGLERNITDAKRTMFDAGYDRVLVMEDDTVVAPNYVGLVTRLMDWTEDHYDNVGVVQGWGPCQDPAETKRQNLAKVYATYVGCHWWAYLQTRESWQSSRALVERYERIHLRSNGSKPKDHDAVRRWIRAEVSGRAFVPRGDRPFPWSEQPLDAFTAPNFSTSQSSVNAVGLWLAGYCRVCTRVNRGQNIGRTGVYCTEDAFKRMGLDKVNLDVFPEDDTLAEFTAK